MKIASEDKGGGKLNHEDREDMTGHVESRRKVKQPRHAAPADRWYTPIQFRPWIVRAITYQPKTRNGSGQPRTSPLRQLIEEIVAAKMAEHRGAETATSSSMAAAGEASAAANTKGDRGATANLLHGVEETLATLSLAEEGFAHQHDSTSTGAAQYALSAAQHALSAAQHVLGARNPPALQFPKPKNPASPRREHRKSLMDFLMPDLANPDPFRRHASTSASASEPAPGKRQGYGVRSDTQSKSKMWPWFPKQESPNRGHKTKQKEEKKCYSALDRAGMDQEGMDQEGRNHKGMDREGMDQERMDRSKSNRNEERVEKRDGEDVANDDTSESELSSSSEQEGESDDDGPAAQDENRKPLRTETSTLSSKERGTESRTSRSSDSGSGRSSSRR